MSGYTKGPWFYTGLFIEDRNGYAVGMAVPWVANGAQVANARLIAAAPKLLEAARKALHEMRHTAAPRTSFTDAVDALDAAISEAERN